jgi:hypothetical protein
MVRPILSGQKRQTRRIIKPQPDFLGAMGDPTVPFKTLDYGLHARIPCPHGQAGDRLWVREAWGYRGGKWDGAKPDLHTHTIEYRADSVRLDFMRAHGDWSGLPTQRPCRADEEYVDYCAYLDRWWAAWRPSIHMPRWACRIQLEITGVRVERLNAISEQDAVAEGVEAFINSDGDEIESATTMFMHLWESINGHDSWDANPWVWVIEFKQVQP